MGLDMFLIASKCISGDCFRSEQDRGKWQAILAAFALSEADIAEDAPFVTFEARVGYWRKANAIHKWFVDNVQDGVDECQRTFVSPEDLVELKTLCEQVVAAPESGPTRLPTADGFFFGSTDYDESYIEDLKRTIAILDRLLNSPGLAGFDLVYQSSWSAPLEERCDGNQAPHLPEVRNADVRMHVEQPRAFGLASRQTYEGYG